MKTRILLLFTLISLTTLHAQSLHESTALIDSIGLRGGTSSDNKANIDTYELFATVPSECEWKIGNKSKLTLKFEAAVGALSHADDTAIYARVGPRFELKFGEFPISLVVSSGPAYLTDHTFGNLDLGGDLQFFTSTGLDWTVSDNWAIGYRWHHISNAGIQEKNPGLNLHTIGLTFRY